MTQKETLSSLVHGNFAKELSISNGKLPPNALEFEKLVIGTFLIDKKGLDDSLDLLTSEVFTIQGISLFFLPYPNSTETVILWT